MAEVKKVKLIRFLTGQEIIAEVVNGNHEHHIVIKNPVGVQVIPSQNNPSQPTVGLFNWTPFSDDKEFTIRADLILVMMNPVIDFINQYNTMLGGLVVPETSKLIKP